MFRWEKLVYSKKVSRLAKINGIRFRNKLRGTLDKTLTKKVVSVLYKKYEIQKVSGGVVGENSWTSSIVTPPEFSQTANGETVVRNVSEKPIYLVLNGNERDFKTLQTGSGVSTEAAKSVVINSSISGDQAARSSIVVLEFNADGQRIGELNVGANSRVRGMLLPDTKFILPTIRLVGSSKIQINRLHLELSEVSGNSTQSSGRLIPLQTSESLNLNADYKAIKDQLSVIEDNFKKLDSHLVDFFVDPPERSESSLVVKANNSRKDGEISSSRESFARELLVEMSRNLPVSNGSHHFGKLPATLGIITDEYMYNFYKDSFEQVVYLHPENYESILETESFDAFLYVTCWKGMENEEWKGVKFREKPKRALDAIVKFAAENQIPTIFQTIEDPSNFDYFLPIAKKFDWVFTSDSDMVPEYKEKLGHDRVFYGEYGANPSVNNPIGSFRHNLNKAFFAGSYPERYPERCADMNLVFDSIPSTKDQLVILDRNFDGDGFNFPESVQSSILGKVPHSTLQGIHKLFRYSLNFNSIKSSPTMCAMRVYELQAQGKPIISNYAMSVFNKFPSIRMLAHDTTLNEFNTVDEYFEELEAAHRLMNDLFARHTSFHVANNIAKIVGLPPVPERNERILVVALGDFGEVLNSFNLQIGVQAEIISYDDFIGGKYLPDDFGYVAGMKQGVPYEADYLRRMLNAFYYTDVLFVSQMVGLESSDFTQGQIHEFVGRSGSVELTMLSTEYDGWESFLRGEAHDVEGVGYAIDPFGVGYGNYLNRQMQKTLSKAPVLSVIVPVFNNGEFLRGKCLPSLRRNRFWDEMEILLIDDGSTDESTIQICRTLESRYPNIKVYSFEDGGSGSASRPRNTGVELASAELVTFLDPDNEISTGGYDRLVEEFKRFNSEGQRIDVVSGYQVKVGETVKFTGRHTAGKPRIVTSAKDEFFGAGKFPVVSTQASVIRKSMLIENKIQFVEKAAGQDTLYGWEVLANANGIVFIDSAYILYYAERSDSVTNRVDPKYFEKCLELEKVQVPALKNLGIFVSYRNAHFENFMKNWYLAKLSLVDNEGYNKAKGILEEIAELNDSKLEDFLK